MPRLRSAAAALLAVTALVAGAASCGGDGRQEARLGVMTRNLYLGAALDPLFAPASVTDVPAAVGALWRTVQASDPPARMAKVAEEIAARRPDLVGLQEAAIFKTRPALVPGAPESTVYDFAQLILDALRARGLGYRIASSSQNFDQAFPDDAGNLVRFTDRDVLLARDGVATSDPKDGRFQNQLAIGVAGTVIGVERGWCAALADTGAGPVRVWNSHLEAASRQVQEAQAGELVRLLAPEAGRLVVLGDMNSPADGSESQSYAILRAASLADAWAASTPGGPAVNPPAGFTCCFAPDLQGGALGSRIDLVLFRGAVDAISTQVVGAAEADRTASGLHPSDHAGVSAALRLR
jgi:endonuclease/exonuclease/phosphatase family metal-dependent hydrolase